MNVLFKNVQNLEHEAQIHFNENVGILDNKVFSIICLGLTLDYTQFSTSPFCSRALRCRSPASYSEDGLQQRQTCGMYIYIRGAIGTSADNSLSHYSIHTQPETCKLFVVNSCMIYFGE